MRNIWDPSYLKRIDYKLLPLIFALMGISILIISSSSLGHQSYGSEFFLTPLAKNQLRAFGIGLLAFFFLACFDYHRLREMSWILYFLILLMLIGLFYTTPIHNVRRWYRFPMLPVDIQPSECAKVVVILALSWYLEKIDGHAHRLKSFLTASLIVFLPFVLIFKQPDLGTAVVLLPISFSMFYVAGVHPRLLRIVLFFGALLFGVVLSIFLGVFSHEDLRDFFTHFMKDYQYERLNPNTYHQKAGQTSIALGKAMGSGFCKSDFMARGWLPYAFTDSVFPAFTEEFGLFGALILLSLFFGLIYFGLHVTSVAKDTFGRLLATGISVYVAVHVIVNVGMMCGFLPITGVPLVLVSYGGSSVLMTMIALGILQSIYARRFRF